MAKKPDAIEAAAKFLDKLGHPDWVYKEVQMREPSLELLERCVVLAAQLGDALMVEDAKRGYAVDAFDIMVEEGRGVVFKYRRLKVRDLP